MVKVRFQGWIYLREQLEDLQHELLILWFLSLFCIIYVFISFVTMKETMNLGGKIEEVKHFCYVFHSLGKNQFFSYLIS